MADKFRSSPPEVFCKKGVLKTFVKLRRKTPVPEYLSLMLKKRLWHRCFPVNFAEAFGTPFSLEHFWWIMKIQQMMKIRHVS